MKALNKFIFLLGFAVMVFSCTKKSTAPTIDDNILNYEIKEVPVTQDYVVGAFYTNIGNFNTSIKEVPKVGKYNIANGVVPAAVMTEHIAQAQRGGIDYFLFSFRSPNRDANNYKTDSTLVKSFLNVNTANQKFALAYNFSNSTYAINTTAPLENDATKLEQFMKDFERVAPFLKDANYIKVNGKTLLYIMNAHILFSNDNAAIYTKLRARMAALDIQMYIVGMQDRWTPPARYPFRYEKGVDAIYHQSFSSELSSYDRWFLLPQAMDQNWQYSRKWFMENIGVDYVPNITPAFTWKILQPANANPTYPRTDNGAMFQKLCNVAKMNASENTRLILIDSWNNWSYDSQLEPAESYGDLYLNITKKQFKK